MVRQTNTDTNPSEVGGLEDGPLEVTENSGGRRPELLVPTTLENSFEISQCPLALDCAELHDKCLFGVFLLDRPRQQAAEHKPSFVSVWLM